MAAAFRAKNRAAWRLALWTLHACRSRAGTTERVPDRSRAGKIVASSLGWSESYGSAQLEFARRILERLPALGEAMREGWLEEQKAAIFTSTLAELDDEQARKVLDRLLGRARSWVSGSCGTRSSTPQPRRGLGRGAQERCAGTRPGGGRTAPRGAPSCAGSTCPMSWRCPLHDRIVALADVAHQTAACWRSGRGKGLVETRVMLRLLGLAVPVSTTRRGRPRHRRLLDPDDVVG